MEGDNVGLGPNQSRVSWWWLLPLAALIGAVGVVRQSVAGTVFDQVWAEDGKIFLHDAVTDGYRSIFVTYSGYAHLVPRLVALPVRFVPMPYVPVAFVLEAALITGLCGAVTTITITRATKRFTVGLLAGGAFALVPAFGVESLNSIASAQWWMLAALAVILVLGEPLGSRHFGAGIFTAACVGSQPLAILLVPLMFVSRRPSQYIPVSIGAAAGLGYQILTLLFGGSSGDIGRRWIATLQTPRRSITDVFSSMITFDERSLSLALIVLLFICYLAAQCSLERLQAGVAVIASSLLFSSVILTVHGFNTPRYLGFYGLLSVIGVALLMAGARLSGGRQVAIVLLLLLLWLGEFRSTPFRVSGPSWRQEVKAFASACRAGKPPPPLRLRPLNWGEVTVPCR